VIFGKVSITTPSDESIRLTYKDLAGIQNYQGEQNNGSSIGNFIACSDANN
jgi:hypothetical protein